MVLSRKEAETQVSSWGFKNVFTWTDRPYVNNARAVFKVDEPIRNAYYPPHSHGGLTTHLILRGELTITYPKDASPSKETYGPGARIDVDAGREHEVWMGREGCTYVIGE